MLEQSDISRGVRLASFLSLFRFYHFVLLRLRSWNSTNILSFKSFGSRLLISDYDRFFICLDVCFTTDAMGFVADALVVLQDAELMCCDSRRACGAFFA